MWFVYALSARVLDVPCRAAHGCCEASYPLMFSLSGYEQEQGWITHWVKWETAPGA